jgi:hypothetical protein
MVRVIKEDQKALITKLGQRIGTKFLKKILKTKTTPSNSVYLYG